MSFSGARRHFTVTESMLKTVNPADPDIHPELDKEMAEFRAFRLGVERSLRPPLNPWWIVLAGAVTGTSIGGAFGIFLFHLY
jgi:hypothetical protein